MLVHYLWAAIYKTLSEKFLVTNQLMEVKINREIRDYTESMFFGLSLRQFAFSILAILFAVGAYFILDPYVGTETVSWVCVIVAAPFAAMGFIKYNGMTAEQIALAWFQSEFLMPKKLMFSAINLYYEAVKPTIEGGKKSEDTKTTVPTR